MIKSGIESGTAFWWDLKGLCVEGSWLVYKRIIMEPIVGFQYTKLIRKTPPFQWSYPPDLKLNSLIGIHPQSRLPNINFGSKNTFGIPA